MSSGFDVVIILVGSLLVIFLTLVIIGPGEQRMYIRERKWWNE